MLTKLRFFDARTHTLLDVTRNDLDRPRWEGSRFLAGRPHLAQITEPLFKLIWGEYFANLVYTSQPSAGWQSGYAAVCNTVYAGSIPTPASTISRALL